ncbi:MAG TPA: class I SAM-dependent methyltransferase [Bryobacteraceae bacterium]|nr:class I SAM-dependent methyltransferase [Bryobacteraceae bacterium]
MNDPFAPVAEIMRKNGIAGDPRAFHAAVNVCFHQFESEVYDDVHQDMWRSLPAQVELLANDCLRGGAPERIRMLDIGCGTGLATDLLLRTALGPRVVEIDLLDTSPAMLARASARRGEQWKKPGGSTEGLVESVAGKSYELIITCSVLHHVPDLASFLGAVSRLQNGIPGALLLHLQDPNGDYSRDPQRLERAAQLPRELPDSIARFKPSRLLGRLMREIKGTQGEDYVSKANRELIRRGVIAKPLRVADVYAITDIHVHDTAGVSIETMRGWMPDYELAAHRSYGFFGVLESSLPPDLRALEDRSIREGALNGEYAAAAWRRRSPHPG